MAQVPVPLVISAMPGRAVRATNTIAISLVNLGGTLKRGMRFLLGLL